MCVHVRTAELVYKSTQKLSIGYKYLREKLLVYSLYAQTKSFRNLKRIDTLSTVSRNEIPCRSLTLGAFAY